MLLAAPHNAAQASRGYKDALHIARRARHVEMQCMLGKAIEAGGGDRSAIINAPHIPVATSRVLRAVRARPRGPDLGTRTQRKGS
eukprot:gene19320-25972_t